MVKRLLLVIVIAFAGLLSACTSPSSPGGGTSPSLESPAESMEESPAAS